MTFIHIVMSTWSPFNIKRIVMSPILYIVYCLLSNTVESDGLHLNDEYAVGIRSGEGTQRVFKRMLCNS